MILSLPHVDEVRQPHVPQFYELESSICLVNTCLYPSGCCAQTMSDSLMYRLSYYRFAEESARQTGRRGYDRVRQCEIGLMDFK